MEISVIGPGRWGSLIASYLDGIGEQVTLYGRPSSENMKRFLKERKNDLLTLTDTLSLTTDLSVALKSEIIIISVGSQAFRRLLEDIVKYEVENKIFVLCMKGIEIETGKRLSEVAKEILPKSVKTAVWLGPGHVEEFTAGNPSCMVIDSEENEVKHFLADRFSSKLIRFYYGDDLLGNEIGAAAKNVIGIAAGILDGLHFSALKGALMARGAREIGRLIKNMGGNELSAYGLCHLGDYEATVFSKYSHNRLFGENFVNGIKSDFLAEGYYTAKALMKLSKDYNTELPICEAVYKVIYENKKPRDVFDSLFSRETKKEF